MERSKAQGIGCLVALAIIGVVGMLGAVAPGGPEQSTAAPVSAPKPFFREIGGQDSYAMIIPNDYDVTLLPADAMEQCGAATHCMVLGWSSAFDAASSLPMTDAQLESLSFRYDRNTFTSLSEARWDCERYPQDDRARCL